MALSKRLPALLVFATLLFLVFVVPAGAQGPSPATQTKTAVGRLVADTTGLTDAQAPAAARAALLADAKRVERLFLRNPCRALRFVGSYRTGLRQVDGATPKT